jgi:hypothetical protein
MTLRGDMSGRVGIESLIELLVVIAVVPPLVCCALQAALTLVAIVVPWVALALLGIGLAACFAAILAAYRGAPRAMGPPPDGGVPLLPPIRRPPGIRGPQEQGRGRRDH